jgi:ATP-dependent RNA helicase DeaD
MNEFEELGLSKKLSGKIEVMGFKSPLDIQKKAIPIALTGKDLLGKSETGSGKTFAFALPILDKIVPNKKVQALVLTPTRELAEQVSSTFEKFSEDVGLEVSAVYGGVSINNQIKKIPYSDIIVGTPGRIIDHLNRKTLDLSNIKYLVLDEVDRMFDMGFYQDVEKIIKHCPEKRQNLFFSATISADIDYLVKRHTKDPVTVSTSSYVDPTKLEQVYYDVPGNMKFSLLVHLLKNEDSNLVMVFCNTKRTADLIAKMLNKTGIDANAIHGDLSQNRRQKTLENFHSEKVGVLVCTDVAARGLDIKGVSHVYNYDLPSKSDDYIHRVGRTARAKKEGKAISILASRDYENFDRILRSNPNLNIKREDMPQIEIINVEMRSEGRESRGFGNRNRNDRRSFGHDDRGRGRRSEERRNFRREKGGRRNLGRNNQDVGDRNSMRSRNWNRGRR